RKGGEYQYHLRWQRGHRTPPQKEFAVRQLLYPKGSLALLLSKNGQSRVSSIPVIIISGSETVEGGLALDGAEYLLKPVAPAHLQAAIQGGAASSLETAQKKRVLVVDDDLVFLRQTEKTLTTAGHEVKGASTGKDALAQLAQEIPDVLILDLMLPDVDGFTILRRLREDRRALSLKVIIVTGQVLTERERTYIKQQLVSAVSKRTHSVAYLMQTVRRVLES
ncbi:MAG: response regulator, partial [Deltaproteobacteria bacterium]|nr:response regulator [Deltaproteobacteria bacterium]